MKKNSFFLKHACVRTIYIKHLFEQNDFENHHTKLTYLYNIYSARCSMVLAHDSLSLIRSKWLDKTFLKIALNKYTFAYWYYFSTNQMVLQQVEILTSFYQSTKTLNVIDQAKVMFAGNRLKIAQIIIIIKCGICTRNIMCFQNHKLTVESVRVSDLLSLHSCYICFLKFKFL